MKLLRPLIAIAIIVTAAAVAFGILRARSVPPKRSSGHEGRASAQRYRLDAAPSKFIAHAMAGGMLWFKGHDHLVAVKEFSGEAQLDPNQTNPASVESTETRNSMTESSSSFAYRRKRITNKDVNDNARRPDQD